MSAAEQTECPFCKSVFRVSAEQLQARGGNVRCGSCLQVFRADQHLRDASSLDDKGHMESADESWAIALLEDTDDSEAALPELTPPRDNTNDSVESWAKNLLSEVAAPVARKTPSTPTLDVELESGAKLTSPTPSMSSPGRTQRASSNTTPPPDAPTQQRTRKTASTATPIPAAPVTARTPTAIAPSEDSKAAPHKISTLFSLERPLAHVDAPVEIEIAPVSYWRQQWRWIAGCGAALLLLSVQYVIWHRHALAADANWRPWLSQTCQVVGCDLPLPSWPQYVRVDELMVRKHPHTSNALMVDAIIRNTATLPQRLPTLSLIFRDNNDQIVASRALLPQEYLLGDGKNLSHMPPSVPIRLSLEVVDPGKTAISYSLNAQP